MTWKSPSVACKLRDVAWKSGLEITNPWPNTWPDKLQDKLQDELQYKLQDELQDELQDKLGVYLNSTRQLLHNSSYVARKMLENGSRIAQPAKPSLAQPSQVWPSLA